MIAREIGVPLVHAGPAPTERLVSVPSAVRVVRAELPTGTLITEALWDLMEPTGARAAAVELGSGTFGDLPYVFPAIGEDPARPMSFTAPQSCPGPAMVLSGSATVGRRFGEKFTHTHATWMDAHGALRGGHLLPDARVGEVPIEVVLRALLDAEQHSSDCEETGLPAFTPGPRDGSTPLSQDAAAAEGTGMPGPRAVISRVRPGVYLDDAVRQVCQRAGFDRAQVRASLGSTVGALLSTADGAITRVDWPAVEFTQLVGFARDIVSGDGTVELQGTVVDIHGEVFNGVVRPGENPVAVTFELYVEEVA